MSIMGLYSTWNYLAIYALIPGLMMSIGMLFMPESPVWLISKTGKYQQMVTTLKNLRLESSDIDEEVRELETNAYKLGQKVAFSWQQFVKPDVFKPLMISVTLMFFLQFSGINAILFYATDILKDAGTSLTPNVSLIIVNASLVIATIPGSLLIDRLGRKILLIISGSGHALSLTVLGLYYYYISLAYAAEEEHNLSSVIFANSSAQIINSSNGSSIALQFSNANNYELDLSWIPVVSLAVFVVSFSIGFGPIPWIVMTGNAIINN